MASWSQRRRFFYGGIVAVLVIAVIAIPAFYILYKPATCFDGVQNQGEQGVDCGGPCVKLCPSAFLALDVSWTSFEQIAPNLYNLAAYIVNPNTTGMAQGVPYQMIVYDKTGMEIVTLNGTVDISPGRNTLAFLPGVSMGKSIPYRVLFQFTGVPQWVKGDDTLGPLQILDKQYSEDVSGSSLAVTLKNTSAVPIDNVTVYAALYDKSANIIGFSKTIVDSVPAGGTATAPFTWPINRQGAVVSIEVLPVTQ